MSTPEFPQGNEAVSSSDEYQCSAEACSVRIKSAAENVRSALQKGLERYQSYIELIEETETKLVYGISHIDSGPVVQLEVDLDNYQFYLINPQGPDGRVHRSAPFDDDVEVINGISEFLRNEGADLQKVEAVAKKLDAVIGKHQNGETMVYIFNLDGKQAFSISYHPRTGYSLNRFIKNGSQENRIAQSLNIDALLDPEKLTLLRPIKPEEDLKKAHALAESKGLTVEGTEFSNGTTAYIFYKDGQRLFQIAYNEVPGYTMSKFKDGGNREEKISFGNYYSFDQLVEANLTKIFPGDQLAQKL